MAPIEDLLRHAESAEELAAFLGGRDRARLLEIAADLHRRAAARERLRFWMAPPSKAAKEVTDIVTDEDWGDAERVCFTLATAGGEARFEAPRTLLPRLVARLAQLSRGEPPDCIVLEPGEWRLVTIHGAMALRLELREGGAICLPMSRLAAARLLSWLHVMLGDLRLRKTGAIPAAIRPAREPAVHYRRGGGSHPFWNRGHGIVLSGG